MFCWKNVSSFCRAKATHIFSAKNIRILYIESAKTVNEMTLNELVKLTTLWTTGSRSLSEAVLRVSPTLSGETAPSKSFLSPSEESHRCVNVMYVFIFFRNRMKGDIEEPGQITLMRNPADTHHWNNIDSTMIRLQGCLPAGIFSISAYDTKFTSRKYTYIIMTPLNPTFI